MLNRFFGPKTHDYLHVLGASGLAFGLPMNKVVMSISMMFLVLNLILEGKFRSYYDNLKKNKLFLLITGFFLLHLIGLIWSENLEYAFHDLRAKLPLLVIPVVLITKPIQIRKELHIVLFVFISSLVITSLLNFSFYNHWIGNRSYDDIRGMSLFSSHVRYSLLLSMGAGILLFQKDTIPSTSKFVIRIALFCWFAFYTYESQVISGYLTFSGVLLIAATYSVWKWNKTMAISLIGIIVIAAVSAAFWIFSPVEMNQDFIKNLPAYTAEGNEYRHSPENISPETKKPIEVNICDKELKREWEKKSHIPYYGRDSKNQLIRTTLIRYLASMDENKDAIGFSKLTDKDISKVENGCASIYCSGALARAYGLKYQLINAENPNGHSLLQRMEYWKTGLQIAKSNLLIGVGTGDVQDTFEGTYEENNSILNPENRKRTHNMYLTVLLTFGVIGLFLFIWMHIEFLTLNFKALNLMAISFVVIALLSYIVEDTLETQTGVTFFGLFYGLFSTKLND